MPRPRGRTITVLLTALVLVGGANIAAYAATGSPLLIGKKNTEHQATTLINTGHGPALKLKSKAGAPSLAVSSSKKVLRLNADKVDGFGAAQLQTTTHRYAVPTSGPYTTATVTFPGLPKGLWMASYTIITSNAGTGPQCFFRQATPTTAEALSWAVNVAGFSANNSVGLIDTRGSAGPVTFFCQGASFSFYSAVGDADSSIAFTSVSKRVTHTIAVSRNPGVPPARGATVTR